MSKIFVFITCLLAFNSSIASVELVDNRFSAETISAELRKNANSVIRLNELKFEIVSERKTIFSVHQIITILNDEGNGYAEQYIYYDALQKVKNVKSVVYNKKGFEIDSFKEKDFYDVSSTSSGTLYDDNRFLYKDLTQKEYPYTVEITYELVNDNLYFIPDYLLLSSYETSVQKSSYQISFPEGLKPRYKEINVKEGDLKVIVEDEITSMTWSYANIKAVKREPFSVSLSNLYPKVLFSPAKFNFEGYQGDFSTWDGMADFQAQLNKDLKGVSDKTKAEVRAITQGLSEIETVKAIYKYMQSRTRYISIQLGVGGFKPFSAESTDRLGYGDCKALTYYTQMLLKEVGVKSYYTWIYGGDNPPHIDKDFPNDSFNHIILFVPLEQDSIWLECTSQTVPAGYLGSFTGDRYGLVINEEAVSAELIRTKSYGEVHNEVLYEVEVQLKEDGYAVVNEQVNFRGMGTNYQGAAYLYNQNEKEQEEWVRNFIDLADFKVNAFDIETTWEPEPSIVCSISFDIRNALKSYGDQLMFQPSLIDPIGVILKLDENRVSPIDFGTNRKYELKANYYPPEGYQFIQGTDSTTLSTKFGKYHYRITTETEKVSYYRTFETVDSIFPQEDYEALRDFFKDIRMAEKKRIKLKKVAP